MASKLGSVDPSRFPDESFDLYSIPAYDAQIPQVELGSAIGSTKQIVAPNDVLLSKIVPHIRRTWIVGENRGRRLIASGEWIVFRSESVAPQFLRHLLRGDAFHAQFMTTVSGVGGSLLRARPAQVAQIQIKVPSLAEQRRIAAILDKADALRVKRTQAIALLDSLARSIFLEMFGDHAAKSWTTTTINAVAASEGGIRTGPFGSQLLHSEFVDEGIAVLGIDNVVANEFRWGASRFITSTKFESLKRYKVSPGDVLITIMGTCGRCAIVPSTIPLAINTKHLCCITLDQKRCLPEFLHSYFLLHPTALRYLQQKAKGAIMDGLNMGTIKEMPLPMAPIELQRAYALRVGAIHRMRQQHEQSLQALEFCFSSLQHRAFTGTL
ncbi:restriction endonuclease subunit S [Paraburkholderia dipogonis]|uniref:Restriction endonuclease subunit S n=1 Tax=Paraburkholderia dipogonis TaxID=1211383 RepID=A0A4Y8N8T6_9BURK|nr:restriction endonuclease subunit S [Paraburkholderia dipogonis]TFE45798.1 restriction endonuclease subunit S [Paraburkholderia dipogonis]